MVVAVMVVVAWAAAETEVELVAATAVVGAVSEVLEEGCLVVAVQADVVARAAREVVRGGVTRVGGI